MALVLKTTKRDLFYDYLTYLDPILKIKDMDRKVLSGLITIHYRYRDYDDKHMLNSLLFSPGTTSFLLKNLDISQAQFDKAFKHLQDRDLIQGSDGTYNLNPVLTQYPKDGRFKINIEFKVEATEGRT